MIRALSPYRIIITRVTLLYYLVFLLWRMASHILPYQLEEPVLTKLRYDFSFWLFRLAGLDRLLVESKTGAIIFTAALLLSCILAIIFPRKRGYIISFSILYLMFTIASNMYLCHSLHYYGMMTWIAVAFWSKKDEIFELLWEGMRYYACWIYGSAFVWKFINGVFFQWNAGVLSFKNNLTEYLYYNPDTAVAHIYYYFLQHSFWLNIGHKFVFLLEGSFIIGFFTKKFDKYLIASGLMIFMSIYFFSDVFFAELQILLLTFLPVTVWRSLNNKLPLLGKG